LSLLKNKEKVPVVLADRILDVAIDQFGRNGFDGTSTRAIAKAAETAMSSITYHFGGKEGLYLACADRVASLMAERQKSGLERGRSAVPASPADATEAAVAIVDSFAAMIVADDAVAWVRFIIREQFEPTEGFERLWDGFMSRMASVMLGLVRTARPDLADDEIAAHCVLLLGQAVILRSGRASISRLMQVDRVGPKQTDALRAQLRSNVRALLAR